MSDQEPDNSPAAIDARLDTMLERGRAADHPPELLLLLDRVYRPFCHAVVDLQNAQVDPLTVARAAALLCANLIKEVSQATSNEPRKGEQQIVSRIRDILRYGRRRTLTLDS